MIIMYDLDDNVLMTFEGYKDCAEYFNTSLESMYSTLCRLKKGTRDKKWDENNKRWVRLYKMEDDND